MNKAFLLVVFFNLFFINLTLAKSNPNMSKGKELKINLVEMAQSLISIDKGTLDIELQMQRTSVWCWAAVVAMIVNYKQDKTYRDCQVLDKFFTSKWERESGCCQRNRRCVVPGSDDDMSEMMGMYDLESKWVAGPLTFEQVVEEIDNDNPIVVGLKDANRNMGHVVVLSGYQTPNRLVILDPQAGRIEASFEQVRGDFGRLKWGKTMLTSAINPESE
ncbi:MAG: C39 family peptidase [Bacteriovoracaceae bacterium]|nr:C39 family peptidase [Bacteriovoracaceae bacterium]